MEAVGYLLWGVIILKFTGTKNIFRQIGRHRFPIYLAQPGGAMVVQANHVVQMHADHAPGETAQPLLMGAVAQLLKNMSMTYIIPETYLALIILSQQKFKLVG